MKERLQTLLGWLALLYGLAGLGVWLYWIARWIYWIYEAINDEDWGDVCFLMIPPAVLALITFIAYYSEEKQKRRMKEEWNKN